MNIYVGNLPLTATDNDLKDIFTEYGEVISAKVITDRETGKSRGFGFVEMGQNAAKKAIDELQDAEFEGRPIVVNEAREKKQGFGGGGNRGGYNRGGGGGDRGNSNRSGGGSRGGW